MRPWSVPARRSRSAGRRGVEALQRQSRDRAFGLERLPAAVAGAGRQERVGVECQEGVGLPDASLGIGGADPDIAEAGSVVGYPGSRHRALYREAVGRQSELYAGCERAAHGRSFGKQLQRAGDVDSRDVEPHAVGESRGRHGVQGEPLVAACELQVGRDPASAAIGDAVVRIDVPCPEVGKDAPLDQAVAPDDGEPQAGRLFVGGLPAQEGPEFPPFDPAREGGVCQRVAPRRGVGDAQLVVQGMSVAGEPGRERVEADASGRQPLDPHPECCGERVAVAAPNLQRLERCAFRAEEVVQYVLPAGCGEQAEPGQQGLQRPHVDPLGAETAAQRVGAAGEGCGQRVERRGAVEDHREVARADAAAGTRRPRREGQLRGADVALAGRAVEADVVERDTGR